MKILVTGANGQLGMEVVQAFRKKNLDVSGIDIEDLDFSKPDGVAAGIAAFQADWVINCAAYTEVDQAEENADLAFLINRDSAAAVADGVNQSGGNLLHISTDFIFGGDQSHPYLEQDPANPLGVYGRSKWEGERAVLEKLPTATILRTAWVYGVHGKNFVKTILRLAGDRDELNVVSDQIGSPSWTSDISCGAWELINADSSGVFNFTNEGVASWYDFAEEILHQARQLDFPVVASRINPIATTDYPTKATRPSYSVLSKKKYRAATGANIPYWRNSLNLMMTDLKKRQADPK